MRPLPVPLGLIALVSAFSLIAGSAAAQATTEPRYALDVAIYRDGVQTIGSHSLVIEGYATTVSISDGFENFELVADVNQVQGDGDGELLLTLNIANNNDEPMQPRLVFRRGGTARMEVGKATDEGMVDGMVLTLSPAAAPVH